MQQDLRRHVSCKMSHLVTNTQWKEEKKLLQANKVDMTLSQKTIKSDEGVNYLIVNANIITFDIDLLLVDVPIACTGFMMGHYF